MCIILQEYVDFVVKQVAYTLKLNDWNYVKLNFDNIGQNYFGIIIPINLCGKQEGRTTNFNLLLKLAPIDERYRVSGAVTIMFAREIYVYANIFTRFISLLNNCSLSAYVMPKLFYVNGDYSKEVIVIENMCAKGFKPYLENMFLDLDHITIGLKVLAHFHALAIVLMERDSNLYQEIESTCVPLSEKTNKRFIDVLLNRLDKALTNFEKSAYETLLKSLKINCVKYTEAAFTDVKILCLCHGDIWKENILFQYEDNKPTSACLIDFQTARICSPAFDVLYLIVSSTDTYLRKKHFHQLLDIYHGSLIEMLNKENVDTDKYSREKFDFDLGIVAPTTFIIANTAMWLSNGLQEEGHVRSKLKCGTETEKLEALIRYKDIIKNLLDDLRSFGYLEL